MVFWVALRKELLEQWRTYRLLIIVVVLLLFGGFIAPLTAKYTPEIVKALAPQGENIASLIPTPTAEVAVQEYVQNVSQFGVLVVLLVTMGTVALEKDRGTAALVLVKPLPRGTFLAAKFVALSLALALGIIIAAAACYYYILLLFNAVDLTNWVASNGLLLLFLLVFVALTLFASTLTRSQVASGGLAFGMLMILTAVGAVPTLGDYLPGRLVTWSATVMAGGGSWWSALWGSLVLMALALAGTWLVFERQEL
jgi:ABC-2 type transport system permease protein